MGTGVVRRRGIQLAIAGLVVAVVTADQVSKSVVVAAHPHGPGPGFGVGVVRNTGASFGIGAGHPYLISLTVVVALALAVTLLVRARSRAVALSLAVVVGGALGNLADRLFRAPGLGRGAVVDWIHVAGYPATFNLADVAIRLGVLGALIAWLVSAHRQRQPEGQSGGRPVAGRC